MALGSTRVLRGLQQCTNIITYTLHDLLSLSGIAQHFRSVKQAAEC